MGKIEPRRRKFDPDAFSLLVNIKGREPLEVEITSEYEVMTLDGPSLKEEKAKRVAQWVIDRYTTQFKNEKALLEDIKANKRALLEGVSLEDASVSMFYNGYDYDAICTKIAYSDSFDLIEILDTCEFNNGTGMLYGDYAEIFTENFKRYMIEKACVHKEAYQYWNYFENNYDDCFYDSNLLIGLLRKHDEKAYEEGIYHLENREYEEEFSKYYNIRAHCLINQDDLNANFHLERLKKNGHPTSLEESLDLKKAKNEVKYHHNKRSINEIEREYLGDRMLEYPRKKDNIVYNDSDFLKDPEEEIDRYNYYYDDEPTEPINKKYENGEDKQILVSYYDKRGQGIIPFKEAKNDAEEIIYYDENEEPLLFNPDEYKKR